MTLARKPARGLARGRVTLYAGKSAQILAKFLLSLSHAPGWEWGLLLLFIRAPSRGDNNTRLGFFIMKGFWGLIVGARYRRRFHELDSDDGRKA